MHKCFDSLNLGAFEVKVLRKKTKTKKTKQSTGWYTSFEFLEERVKLDHKV